MQASDGWILGVHVGHDASVSVLHDGVPVLCLSEERLSRLKGHRGFPHQSLAFALSSLSLRARDISVIALDTRDLLRSSGRARLLQYVARNSTERLRATALRGLAATRGVISGFREVDTASSASDPIRAFLGTHGVDSPRVRVFDHHDCHAAAAFELSPFDEALFVTSDARGDGRSASIGFASIAQRTALRSISDRASLGQFFGAVTSYLGFTPNRHEGKVMGLAGSGDACVIGHQFEKLIRWDSRFGTYELALPEAFRIEVAGHWPGGAGGAELSVREQFFLLRQPCRDIAEYKARWLGTLRYLEAVTAGLCREDVAAGAQHLLETTIERFVRAHHPGKAPMPVVLSGGVFANVHVNRAVSNLPMVSDVFVQPAMGDEGLSLGAALLAWRQQSGEPWRKPAAVGHTFLGPSFSRPRIEGACRRVSDSARVVSYTPAEIAERIREGAIVGLFQGAMEFGPRSLGNRSILATPTDHRIPARLNARLGRSEFMPFAPSVLAEHADTYFEFPGRSHEASNYMTIAYPVRPEVRARIPAVVHVDGTARPQLVHRQTNPFFYAIIEEFFRLTGIPLVLNTSFNAHEEPIVCSPEDALAALRSGRVDVIAFGTLVAERF